MKKIRYSLTLIVLSLFCGFTSNAQKKLNLVVRYDSEFKRYEVCVKSNFDERNFTWGPSQISLVLPSNVLVDKIRINNLDGGAWDDNSIVQAPEVTPEKSFHGISSSGDKTNLVAGYESVLFYFTLPENINPTDVKIFNNNTDPKSSARGMMGGDFRNSIVDVTGNERFSTVYMKEQTIAPKVEVSSNFTATVYPNVITDNKFQVKVDGITEGDILMILSDENGREIKRLKGTRDVLEKQVFELSNSEVAKGFVLKLISEKGSISKRLIAEK